MIVLDLIIGLGHVSLNPDMMNQQVSLNICGIPILLKLMGKITSIEDITPVKKYIHDICIRCGKVAKR